MSNYAKYSDAIAGAEPAEVDAQAHQHDDHAEHHDEEEFSGGAKSMTRSKTKIAKKRERKNEDCSNLTTTGKKIEKADDDEPATLADKVAQDFKNKALVDPTAEFKVTDAATRFWMYGGLVLGQKF